MQNDTLKVFTVQTHIHGSGGHGSGSHRGYDYIAAREGMVDVVWWMEHEWRLANFAAVQRYSFDSMQEYLHTPNRNPHSEESMSKITMKWEKVEGDSGAEAAISLKKVYRGNGSLRLSLSDAGKCVYGFNVDNKRETFPIFTHPIIRLAIYPGENIGQGGEAFIRFALSQQPPDFSCPELIYTLGAETDSIEHRENKTIIYKNWKPGTWNRLELDIAGDILRAGVDGGLDNCLRDIQIGIKSEEPQVCAYFDSLEFEPGITGTAGLEKERELIEELPLELKHHVGTEMSYYGQHINSFGSTVPIPDYGELYPKRLSSHEVVKHIRDHGGLASINHPKIDNMNETAEHLAQNDMFGAELIEVNHKRRGLLERIRLWDRLSEKGLIVTAVTGTDCHGISLDRVDSEEPPSNWVNHIWAESKEEADLLEGLRRGHLYLSDPSQFRGKIVIEGPEDSKMGDLLIIDNQREVAVEVAISGLRENDIVLWLVNGHIVHASRTGSATYREKLTLPFEIGDNLKAVRVQVIRPELVGSEYQGVIAFSNPLYLTGREISTRHRIKRMG